MRGHLQRRARTPHLEQCRTLLEQMGQRAVKDWANTETLVLLALLVGIALGTLSGYTLALDLTPYRFDNDIRNPDRR